MMLELATPEVFEPLIDPARYKGAVGGRGSGKSYFFAESIIEHALMYPGNRAVCIREVQNTLKESSKRLIEDKLIEHNLGSVQGFKVFKDVIETPGDGIIIFQGMQDTNAESIKSLSGFRIAWVEEAQTLSAHSLSLLRPTIREEGSELWFSWNARRKSDPVDMLLRGESLPTGAKVVTANWRDNPFFPAVLEQERQDCLRLQPDQYEHIWEGGYATILVGAYYAQAINQAKAEHRVGRVAADPLLPVKLFVDIGGTGAKSDAFVIWVAQFVGKEIRLLDYYETVGQPMSAHMAWLREKGYNPVDAQVYLPHDGRQMDKVYQVSYESSFRDAGYQVTIVPNQGAGAAKLRIESGRRMFPSCWFNADKTAPGLEALGWYHEKQDDTRQIGLGPEHDWASHGADSFGMMCVAAEQQFAIDPRWSVIDYTKMDRGIAA
jgi:phage terminase large subunit